MAEVNGPDLALQKAVIAHLRAASGVTTHVAQRIYDEPPQSVEFPYVRFGHVELSALWFTCGADDDVTFSVEVHSRPQAGRVEAARIAHQVRLALDNADLDLTGYHLDWIEYQTQTVTRSADGRSYVGLVAFAAALSEAPAAP